MSSDPHQRPPSGPVPLSRISCISRRQWLQATGGAALLAAGWSSGQAAQPLAATPAVDLSGVTLRIAVYKGGHQTLLQAAGLADTPYRIEWKEFNSGVLHIEAINGDALDVGSGSEIPPVFAARARSPVRIIAVYHEDLNNQGTFLPKDSTVRSVAELRGKRVGYVRGTTAHYYLYKQLTEAGLGFNDIKAINLTPADGLSAFARGDLDAWAIWGYNGQLARTRYNARTLKTGVGYLSGNFLIYGNPKAIADPLRHAAIADYLQRLQRAYVWSNANYRSYAEAQSRETRVPVGDILELYNNRSQDSSLVATDEAAIRSHQQVADVFQMIGVLDGPADVRPLWDRSFIF